MHLLCKFMGEVNFTVRCNGCLAHVRTNLGTDPHRDRRVLAHNCDTCCLALSRRYSAAQRALVRHVFCLCACCLRLTSFRYHVHLQSGKEVILGDINSLSLVAPSVEARALDNLPRVRGSNLLAVLKHFASVDESTLPSTFLLLRVMSMSD